MFFTIFLFVYTVAVMIIIDILYRYEIIYLVGIDYFYLFISFVSILSSSPFILISKKFIRKDLLIRSDEYSKEVFYVLIFSGFGGFVYVMLDKMKSEADICTYCYIITGSSAICFATAKQIWGYINDKS